MLTYLKFRTFLFSVGVLSLFALTGCLPGQGSQPTPVVIVQNPQGTIVGNGQAMAPTPTPVAAANLVQNGDFLADWNTGWQRDTGGQINGQSVTEVVSASRAASGHAVRLVHDGSDVLSIYQEVPLESLNVTVTAQVNPTAETPCKGILAHCSGMSGMAFYFLDKNNADLGALIYLYPGTDEKLRQTSNATLRYVFLNPGWQTIRFQVRQELVNTLPSIDVRAVTGLRVMIVAGSVGKCGPGDCHAEVIATDIQIVPTEQ